MLVIAYGNVFDKARPGFVAYGIVIYRPVGKGVSCAGRFNEVIITILDYGYTADSENTLVVS